MMLIDEFRLPCVAGTMTTGKRKGATLSRTRDSWELITIHSQALPIGADQQGRALLPAMEVEMTADPSAAERAYRRLKSDILTGVLATGPLDIRGLGDRLRMSVTPVREALARLSAERLVKLAPHHGYAIANPTARRLSNLYELSGVLVDFALERCEHASTATHPSKPQWTRAMSYAEGLAELIQAIAAGQSNRELGDYLHALSDRLFPARRCEPGVFQTATEDLDMLTILWTKRDLSELRLRFRSHHAGRVERIDAIANALAEWSGDL
jgi:DNA-binding GntR family transcriptional regulator